MPRASSGGIGAGGSPCARRAGAILPMILEHNGSLTSLRAERAEGCKMAKMSAGDLKALLSAERYDALSAMAASKLSDERASALNYYMGNMSKDMPAPDGRSKAVSSDVADTIEGLMPPLMDIFASGDEVVQFAPVGPEDVAAAEQETDYVNHVFMQQNPGFLVLYSFIKDALLSKVGVVKVWWECREEVERETYLDQPDDAFALIVSQPGVEVVEHTEREISLPHAEEPWRGFSISPALGRAAACCRLRTPIPSTTTATRCWAISPACSKAAISASRSAMDWRDGSRGSASISGASRRLKPIARSPKPASPTRWPRPPR
jgi:hypothetical protein